jgi:flagellar motility protein MotE (MotC chaperone)
MKRACISLFFLIALMLVAFTAHAQVDAEDTMEKQKLEMAKKEEIVKQESERLKTLKKEVEDDIAKYTELLQQIEKSLQQVEEAGNKRLRHVAKAYEAMQPEDAAVRLGGLDDETAVQILLKMDSKKAGLVIGMMDAKKATFLTKEIAKLKL